jgi:hypothetical protein
MEHYWKETEKTIDGGCVGRLTNYENKKIGNRKPSIGKPGINLQRNLKPTPGCKATGRRRRRRMKPDVKEYTYPNNCVAAWSNECTVFSRSNTGIAISKPVRGIGVRPHSSVIYCQRSRAYQMSVRFVVSCYFCIGTGEEGLNNRKWQGKNSAMIIVTCCAARSVSKQH